MEDLVGHDVDEPVDGLRIVNKENEFSFKPGGSNGFSENSMNAYSDSLDGRNLDRIGSSDQASTSPHCQEEAGVTVSELTLKNYDAIVGTSSIREKVQNTQNKWQNLYQVSGGSGKSNLHGQTGVEGKGQVASRKEGSNSKEPQLNYNNDAMMDSLFSGDDNKSFTDMLHSSRDYLKSSLMTKRPIRRNPTGANLTNSVAPLCLTTHHITPPSRGVSEPRISLGPNSYSDGIKLREWIDMKQYKADKAYSLLIFRQILDLVHASHSRGVPIRDLKPSCFKLLGSCNITYIGSSGQAGAMKNVTNQNIRQLNRVQTEKRPALENVLPIDRHSMKKRKLVENMKSVQRWPQFPSRSGASTLSKRYADDEPRLNLESKSQRMSSNHNEPSYPGPLSCTVLEEEWYTSPELSDKNNCTFASNIYSLGVLLFELLAMFDSRRNHAAAMQDLRHRILPPSFLSENPKEAGFCLWLLHPEPSSRPPTREILQSEFVSGNHEISGGKLLPSIDEEDEESELLSHFLSSLNEVKEKAESNLVEQIRRIEADIQEIEKRRPKNVLVPSSSSQKSEVKLKTNFEHLESAYFSMRSFIKPSHSDETSDKELDPLKFREKKSAMRTDQEHVATDCLGGFFDGLCKYARFNKFKVQGIVRNGEFSKSANVMCLSFDRDENYLASGGVSKKIKVYDYQSLLNDSVDIHYPAVEMVNQSKLSCVSWNGYIRNYLASSDYDGTVQLWDAATGQGFSNFSEHVARAWSVDFSRVDPYKLASGSDDRSVKIWSINDKNSICTIRSNANVCSVQFSDVSSNLLAFSSADHKTYCYDLRNASTPWCVLAGHTKAVSYAKFLDAGTLVSASVDNTLKIWDLNKTNSNSLSRDACISTLRGHTNEKNFVGLSVADGYIACGSETNEVFAYYKSLPMPITAHKFGSTDPVTGKESEHHNGHFVTSVCWRRKSNTVVAANSSGSIKLLQMV